MSEPKRIGRYRLLGVSGTGTFATVYRAEDERLGDVVAVKVLAENHSLNADVRERFLQEGRALRRIDSPHVVAVHDLCETDRQQPVLVMQYADRGDLADRVASRRNAGWAPTANDVLAVARSLTYAIEATHRARIVHRDLSPRNVLLRSSNHREDATTTTVAVGDAAAALVADDEQLLLADLGLCKDLALHSGLTVAGGTSGFRAPEQRGGSGFVAPSTDLWSLSALLTWLITGHAPSDGDDVTAQVTELGFPPELGVAIEAGLAQHPDARPPDARSWLADLESALATSSPAERPATEPAGPTMEGTGEGGVEPHRRSLRASAIAAIAVVTLALVATLTLAVGDGIERTELAGGDVLLERVSDDARLGLAGPEEVVVGERATFLADHSGLASLTWFAPDGAVVEGEPTLTFTALSPGLVRVHLTGVTESGELLQLTHELRARQADD